MPKYEIKKSCEWLYGVYDNENNWWYKKDLTEEEAETCLEYLNSDSHLAYLKAQKS